MIQAIRDQDFMGIAGRLGNVLETVTIKEYPVIQEIKDKVPSLASPVLFTDLPDCLEVHILKRGKIRSGEPFLELHNKEKQEVG